MDTYFGEWWDAPAFDGAIEVPVPVGEDCGYCKEEIGAEDSGTFQHFDGERKPIHIECWLRVLGSPAHCRGECSCSGGEEPADDRSWREQGREVMRMVREREGMFRA